MSEGEPLVPLLVDGSGRDGTTLTMQLLATAPEIAFDRVYPYEQRYLSYLLHWARLPTRAGWDEASWNLDSLAHSRALEKLGVAGPLPWHERSLINEEVDGQEFWQDAFAAAWASFSARARRAVQARLGDPAQEVRFYAQKNADSWEMPFASLPGARLVCLLRDPRDVWISSVAFHRRRAAEGGTFLPVALGAPEEEALAQFLDDQRLRLRWLPEAEEELGAPIVRYERLIADLPEEAERLGDWLGVELDAGAVRRRRAEFSAHITAGDVEGSVGRWRREMAPELAARFWAEMGAELAACGYEA